MPSESIRNLKPSYKNGKDKIGRDLLQPCLQECTLYRRGTAFFSSSALKSYASSIDHILKDNVKIEILCSPVVSDRSLIEILQKNTTDEQRKRTIQKLSDDIVLAAIGFGINPERNDYKSKLLSYLIANGQIEIRFAIIKNNPIPFDDEQNLERDNSRNLYHVKTGYFVFPDKSIVAFDGSFNESDSALSYNIESTQVFKSWDNNDIARVNSLTTEIDEDWNKKNPYIEVLELSQEAIDKIRATAPQNRPRPNNPPEKNPEPKEIEPNNGLRDYQNKALEEWAKNDFKGIFAMATGSGKTRTAIHAIKSFRDSVPGGFILIVVPYQPLALQWIREIKEFANIDAIPAFKSYTEWYDGLKNDCLNASMGVTNAPCIVAVEDTFKSERFQELLGIIESGPEKNHLFISDECHHFNKPKHIKYLPEFFKYRIGLSATPYDQFDESFDNKILEKYFGKIIFTYSLTEAIASGNLCPYEYNVIEVSLNSEETEKYEELSRKIGQAKAISDNYSGQNSTALDALLSERSRRIGNIEDKLFKFLQHIEKTGIQSYTLVYSGDGSNEDEELPEEEKIRQIEQITQVLNELNWKVGRITANESLKKREDTIDAFKRKLLDVIVSIRILDEGIDIPACQTAYILASKRSERVFIQRRGRLLRNSPGKEKAVIYDFVITGAATNSEYTNRLVKSELQRVWHFAKDAINGSEIVSRYTELAERVELFKDDQDD
jgi:superfamily II DNA or RNA helicase